MSAAKRVQALVTAPYMTHAVMNSTRKPQRDLFRRLICCTIKKSLVANASEKEALIKGSATAAKNCYLLTNEAIPPQGSCERVIVDAIVGGVSVKSLIPESSLPEFHACMNAHVAGLGFSNEFVKNVLVGICAQGVMVRKATYKEWGNAPVVRGPYQTLIVTFPNKISLRVLIASGQPYVQTFEF